MIFDVKSATVALIIALINSVSSYPHSVKAPKTNSEKSEAENREIKKDNIIKQHPIQTNNQQSHDDNVKEHVKLFSKHEKLKQKLEEGQHNNNNQQNESVITGAIEINDKNIEGHIELPSDDDNLQKQNPKNKVNNNNQQNEDVIAGSVEINAENIKGHIELPSDDDNLQQQYPKDKVNNNNQQNEDFIAGSVEINDENIKEHIELPSDDDNLQQQYPKDKVNNNNQQNEDVIAGSIEINDENIEGHIELPSDDDNLQQQYAKDKVNNNNNQQNEGFITGSIEINDDYIEGNIEVPSDPDKKKYTNNIKQHDGDVIAGSIDIGDENIEGHIELPSDDDKLQQQYSKDKVNNNNNQQNEGFITGSIEINDDYIEGNIELPSDPDKKKYTNNIKQHDGDVIAGSIDIGDENIEGHIELPSDDDKLQQQYSKDKVNNNHNQQNESFITGSIEINDDYIEGNIELPSDPDKKKYTNNIKQHDGDVIAGSIDISDENIEEHIELPSDDENLQHQYSKNKLNNSHQNEDLVTGSIEINDENIKGHIELPSDDDKLQQQYSKDKVNNNHNQQNESFITGSIEINDDYIEGNIELPSDPDKEKYTNNSKQHDSDVIAGSIDISDENIQGHIELPSDDDMQQNKMQSGDSGAFNEIKDDSNDNLVDSNKGNLDISDIKKQPQSGKNCWMTLKTKHYLDSLDKIDATYEQARHKYQAQVGKEFDKKMMEVMLESHGAAPRAVHQAQGDPSRIPAGINLGGACMMRMPGSILFFHRMKLRNSTRFSVNYLQTDLVNMALVVRLSLNDLHLKGAYERATSGSSPGTLYYIPNFGEVEILLKKVFYKMEGRLRMLNNRLIIELVDSNIITNDILMAYVNDSTSMKLEPRNIEDFLERLQCDLDLWLKDYFNDYLMYFGIMGGSNSEILTYEKKKTIKLNEYADDAIQGIKDRLRSLGASSVKIPDFSIFSVPNIYVNLMNGELRGLDSIYRRSVCTTKKDKNIRQFDVTVGFSNLKVEYKYEALITPGTPPLTGKLILTSDELTAQMELSQLAQPETVDIMFDSIIQTKPNALTIEGPASRLIATFRKLLEHPIIAIMSNSMNHNIKMLKTLPRCVPYIYGTGRQIKSGDDGNETYVANSNPEDIKPRDNASKYTDDAPHYNSDSEYHPNNNIDENASSHLGDGISDLSSGEGNGNDKDWSDYILSKNDSDGKVKTVDGKQITFRLKRDAKFVLSKVP